MVWSSGSGFGSGFRHRVQSRVQVRGSVQDSGPSRLAVRFGVRLRFGRGAKYELRTGAHRGGGFGFGFRAVREGRGGSGSGSGSDPGSSSGSGLGSGSTLAILVSTRVPSLVWSSGLGFGSGFGSRICSGLPVQGSAQQSGVWVRGSVHSGPEFGLQVRASVQGSGPEFGLEFRFGVRFRVQVPSSV